jgi:hypothetical protein
MIKMPSLLSTQDFSGRHLVVEFLPDINGLYSFMWSRNIFFVFSNSSNKYDFYPLHGLYLPLANINIQKHVRKERFYRWNL